MGVKYTLPPLASAPQKKNYQPLFGKSLASYKVTSSDLKGACFYLVSGHGGPDPGAIGKMGSHELHEDEYAYDIMLRLARNLLTRGAKVHIIIKMQRTEYVTSNSSITANGKLVWVVRSPSAK